MGTTDTLFVFQRGTALNPINKALVQSYINVYSRLNTLGVTKTRGIFLYMYSVKSSPPIELTTDYSER